MDLGPLRASAKFVLDQMEYSSNASVQAQYSGTGVTITTESSIKQEGSYSLKAVIDGTNDRNFSRTFSTNLLGFQSITVWTRSTATSSAIQFFLSDGTNSSYWNVTTDSSANTWKQHTLTLASPDANSGSPANLSAIASYGYRLLDASATYYFDTIKAIVGMKVAVRGTNLGSYYRHVYLGVSPLLVDTQASPTITAPSANPRYDILLIDTSGTLSWVTGTESASPTIPWSSIARNKIPLAIVYCKTTMTKVLDYEDKDTDANQGYIFADVRPFINLSMGWAKGVDVASASTTTLGNDGNVFDITGTTQINTITAKPAGECVFLQFDGILTVKDGTGNLKLNGDFQTAAESTLTLCSDGTNWNEFARQPTASTFLGLTDTPSSYSGQALKYTRVNSGETAIEFVADPFNTTSGHDHDGTDSKKVLATNLDPTGITDGHFVKRSGSALAGVALSQPKHRFSVYSNTQSVDSGGSGPVKVKFDVEEFDEGGNFDPATNYRFTAPVTGKYLIGVTVRIQTAGFSFYVDLYKNGSSFKRVGNGTDVDANDYMTVSATFILSLNSGDYLEVYFGKDTGAAGSIATGTGQANSSFCGTLLEDISGL